MAGRRTNERREPAQRAPRRARAGPVAAGILILLPVAWYWGSPQSTLWSIGDAARRGNSDRLAAYVDYAALTAEHQAGFRRAWKGALDDGERISSAPLAALAERMLAGPQARRVVSCADVTPWLRELPGQFGWRARAGTKGDRVRIVYRGLDLFEARDHDNPEGGGVLTFRRHGLAWRLEGMRYGQQ